MAGTQTVAKDEGIATVLVPIPIPESKLAIILSAAALVVYSCTRITALLMQERCQKVETEKR